MHRCYIVARAARAAEAVLLSRDRPPAGHHSISPSSSRAIQQTVEHTARLALQLLGAHPGPTVDRGFSPVADSRAGDTSSHKQMSDTDVAVETGALAEPVDRRLHAGSRTVWFNGKFVPEHEARVSIFDEALMYGTMAFEMTRTYGGKPFCLREHLVRLYNSLKMMKIDPGMTLDEMEALTLEVLESNKPTEDSDVDWQIMHDVSRGTMGIYQSIGEGGDNDGRPTVSINCWPLITHQGSYAPKYTSGVDLVVSPVQQLPAHLLDLKAKTRSRLHYKMAELAAQPLVRAATRQFGFDYVRMRPSHCC